MVWGQIAAAGGVVALNYILARKAAAEQAGADERYIKALTKLADRLEREWSLPEGLDVPLLDEEAFSPEEYSVLQSFEPQLAQMVDEKYPTLVERDLPSSIAQGQALEQYTQKALSSNGTAESRAARARALYEQEAATRRAQQSALQQLTQSGLAGSGAGVVGLMSAAQDAQEAGRRSALEAAAMDERAQMEALAGMSGLATNMRGQEEGRDTNNANTINAFNERASKARWLYEQQKANTMNDAQKYNINQAQGVADKNVAGRNQAKKDRFGAEIDLARMRNENAWKIADSKNHRLTTALGMRGDVVDAGNKANRNRISGKYGAISNAISTVPSWYSMFSKLGEDGTNSNKGNNKSNTSKPPVATDTAATSMAATMPLNYGYEEPQVNVGEEDEINYNKGW